MTFIFFSSYDFQVPSYGFSLHIIFKLHDLAFFLHMILKPHDFVPFPLYNFQVSSFIFLSISSHKSHDFPFFSQYDFKAPRSSIVPLLWFSSPKILYRSLLVTFKRHDLLVSSPRDLQHNQHPIGAKTSFRKTIHRGKSSPRNPVTHATLFFEPNKHGTGIYSW